MWTTTAHCLHTRCMSIGSLQATLWEIRQVHGLKLQLCLLVSLWILYVETNNFKLFKMQKFQILMNMKVAQTSLVGPMS